MKISADDQKGLSVILFFLALLFLLLGVAGRMKMDFHYANEIFTAGLTAAAISAGLGVIVFLFSLRKKQG